MTACLLVGAKMVETSALTGLERAEPSLKVMLRVKRGAAALPGGPGKDRPDGGPDAGVRITGDQDHALGVVGRGDLEAALSQGPQDKDVQKSVVSASPRAIPRISRRPSADTPVATTSAWQTTLRPTLTSRWVAPGEQVGEPGVIQAAGQALVHALVDLLADPRDRGPGDPRLVAQGPHEVARPCGWRPPRLRAEQITAHLGLVHPAAGVEQGGEERPGAQLGDGQFHLPGGRGHRLGSAPGAPVGARRSASRRSQRRPRTSIRPARPGPGAGGGRRPSSKIGVGQDLPNQDGHGPLVRGGHRGSTSW